MVEHIYAILILIIVLAILWGVLKFLLRITFQLFSCGCLAIVVLGVVLWLLSYFKVF